MNTTRKYLKYKKKYLEEKEYFVGGTNEDDIKNILSVSNAFETYGKLLPTNPQKKLYDEYCSFIPLCVYTKHKEELIEKVKNWFQTPVRYPELTEEMKTNMQAIFNLRTKVDLSQVLKLLPSSYEFSTEKLKELDGCDDIKDFFLGGIYASEESSAEVVSQIKSCLIKLVSTQIFSKRLLETLKDRKCYIFITNFSGKGVFLPGNLKGLQAIEYILFGADGNKLASALTQRELLFLNALVFPIISVNYNLKPTI
jgi:hypothetical protein